MTDEQRADPRFYPDNRETRTAFFRRRYERELAAYDGPPPSPVRNNAAGLRCWWSAPGRTLDFVLEHISPYLIFFVILSSNSKNPLGSPLETLASPGRNLHPSGAK
jgi:hypothetical protein